MRSILILWFRDPRWFYDFEIHIDSMISRSTLVLWSRDPHWFYGFEIHIGSMISRYTLSLWFRDRLILRIDPSRQVSIEEPILTPYAPLRIWNGAKTINNIENMVKLKETLHIAHCPLHIDPIVYIVWPKWIWHCCCTEEQNMASMSPELMADKLVREAQRGGSTDNISCVVIPSLNQ